MSDREICLIVLREVLIAHDLTAMVQDARPDLAVLWAATPDEALLHLGNGDHVAIAFVSTLPNSFAQTPLATRMAQDAGLVVYLGYDAEEHRFDPSVTALRYPFSVDDLLLVLPKKK